MVAIFEHAVQVQPVQYIDIRIKIAQVQTVLLTFITNMQYFGYFKILYYLSRLWSLTQYMHCLQVKRGSVKVNAS